MPSGTKARGAIERRMLWPCEPIEAGGPRWKISAKWIEFECGCTAERTEKIWTEPASGDPIIFRGLPELAVYEQVCRHHEPAMNKRLHFNAWVSFDQWKRHRRHLLMGRTLGTF